MAFTPDPEFSRLVEKQSGQKISACYQCGKCTAGCPANPFMDGGPRWALRAIQLGLKDEVLDSLTPWMCLFCATCSARCPAGIEIHQVMETLRLMVLAEGRRPARREVELFHRLFLRQVGSLGRVYELGLAGAFNLLSGHPLQNLSLLPYLLSRGKLPLLPKGSQGRLKGIVSRTRKVEGGHG